GRETGTWIESDFLYLLKSAAIAKDHTEFAHAIAKRNITRVLQFSHQRVPRSRLQRLVPSGKSFGDSIEHVGLESFRPPGGDLDQLVQRRGIPFGILGEASSDERA